MEAQGAFLQGGSHFAKEQTEKNSEISSKESLFKQKPAKKCCAPILSEHIERVTFPIPLRQPHNQITKAVRVS